MTTQSMIKKLSMDEKEAMIEALQNRVQYLEANLHLALQVLNNIEKEAQDYSSEYTNRSSINVNSSNGASINSGIDSYSQGQTIEVVATDKIALPTFLNARTWKQQNPSQLMLKVIKAS